MNAVFADTFFFLAALNARDRRHAQAVQMLSNLTRPIVTTAFVLTEVADGLAHRSTRSIAIELERELRSDPRFILIPAEDELWQAAMRLYTARPDKDWSLTDCISFLVMERQGITDALTGDHHFEQAGFAILMPSE